jgi:hypothetical protein
MYPRKRFGTISFWPNALDFDCSIAMTLLSSLQPLILGLNESSGFPQAGANKAVVIDDAKFLQRKLV